MSSVWPSDVGSAFLSLSFLTYLAGFVRLPFRDVGVGFEEPHLRFIMF